MKTDNLSIKEIHIRIEIQFVSATSFPSSPCSQYLRSLVSVAIF
ncbi:hypothetical protein HMPREF1985_01872 [Mitsuokella sp. oral taxon 131 str. W9106]|nr:hypothetical protein HMPREF1985_01872 [Mitsuokella sp. oral taxon 131 str. W9106]